MTDAPKDAGVEPLVLYDGECGLCHASVRFILKRERAPTFAFAPLDGETAAAMKTRFPDAIPENMSTVIVVDGDEVLLRSRAFFRIARHLRWPWRALAVFRFLPAFLTDLPYRLIARFRRRIWGSADACSMPSPGHAERMRP
jgi:predicted DCC family thiol-disulfide oxidoreductase YuxK